MASVVFPASLKEIGEHAFEDCVALTEIDLSKTALQEISSDAFRETGLKKVTLPASLKKIGSESRKDIELFFEKKVFLELFVKVKPKWRENDMQLKEYGY